LRRIKAYLFTIARHLYLDGRRAQARLTALDTDVASDARSAEDRATARSEFAHVRAAIHQLPEDDRTALLIRDEPGSRLLWLGAAWFWFDYVRLTWRLHTKLPA